MSKPSADEVVRTHGPAVLRTLQKLFGKHADIEDTFQQVMLEVVRSLPAFQGNSELATWIHRITLNIAYQRMRATYRGREVEIIELDDLEHSPPIPDLDIEAQVADAEAVRQLYDALEALPPKKRMAVVLHDVEGLTLREISERLGTPLQTVASQLHTGRTLLAREVMARRRATGASVTPLRRRGES